MVDKGEPMPLLSLAPAAEKDAVTAAGGASVEARVGRTPVFHVTQRTLDPMWAITG